MLRDHIHLKKIAFDYAKGKNIITGIYNYNNINNDFSLSKNIYGIDILKDSLLKSELNGTNFVESDKYYICHQFLTNGIRALAIMIIVWYHFWQQSWLIPSFSLINIDIIPRFGFLLVDMLILLSSFCLYFKRIA